jgi:hypothetical protein
MALVSATPGWTPTAGYQAAIPLAAVHASDRAGAAASLRAQSKIIA